MRAHRSRDIPVTTIAVVVVLMAAEWVILVAGVRLHEMVLGAACVAAASLFFLTVLQSQTLTVNFLLRDICAVWRVPWYVLTNTLTLCDVLAKDLAGRQAESFYRVSGFKSSKSDPTLLARRVLATAYTTVSPNSIVIGIDYEQSRMLLHQVKRGEVSRMTKDLGGQP